jgi:DNA-directed RNA polymerase specialized sigma24 family protein
MAGPADHADALRDGVADAEDVRRMGPEDEAVAREEFARLLAVLPEDLQRVFALRLAGYTNAEIGARVGRVERTVELKMKAIRALLRPLLDGTPSAGPGSPPAP